MHNSEPTPPKNRTTVERTSDHDMVVTRTFNAPARIVYAAWTTSELFKRCWAPKSMGVPMFSHAADVRVGGSYRVEFGQDASSTMAFFGTYIEVVPNARLAWTNEESEDGPVTTVTFEEKDGQTLLVLREVYPTKAGLDVALEGLDEILPEQFGQLDEVWSNWVRRGRDGGAGPGLPAI